MKRSLFWIAAALAIVPASASAKVISFSDYNSGYFSYGYGTGGSTFTPFTQSYAGNCFDVATLACKTSGNDHTQPVIAFNTGPATSTGTVDLPAGSVLLHPGPEASGQDAILIFTAPRSGNYSLTGGFQRLDHTDSGNGVTVGLYVNNAFPSTGSIAPATGNPIIPFGGTGFLSAGDKLSFVVGNNGEYTFDSTGIFGSLTGAVPEPSTWAMMILGLGAVGGMMRRRKAMTGPAFT